MAAELSSSPALSSLRRRVRARPLLLDLAIPCVVLLLLAAPALFTNSGFVDDWVNHLWLMWLQSREISATGHPSLFINVEPLGAFYPNFAFYGGTLYAVGGYLTVLTGAPVAVFVALIILALAACYGGTLWIARQAGVDGLAAHVPAAIIVTGAYYLSLAYGRGSWPELLATSMIPLILACALRIVRRGATLGLILLLGGATTIWSGSHNLSFALGTVFLAAIGTCVLLAWAPNVTQAHIRRLGVALGVLLLGVMVNGWFLLPDLSYSLHTQIAQYRALDPAVSATFSRLSVVFDPLRARATDSSYLRSHFTELPVLVLAWLVAAVALLWRRSSMPVRKLVALLAIPLTVLLVLLVDEPLWQKLPSTLSLVQFTFRLQTYIVAILAGLTIVVLVAIKAAARERRASVLTGALVAIALLSLGLGVWQVWNSTAYFYSPRYLSNRSLVLRYPHRTPPTWYEIGQFRDIGDLAVPTEGAVRLNVAAIKGERTSQIVSIPPGEGPLASNIAASANLVSVSGLRIAGRTSDGFLALERPPSNVRSVRLTVSRADTSPMRLGPILTLLGALGLAGAALASALLTRSRRRRGQAAPHGG